MKQKTLVWELLDWPGNPAYGKAWRAKVGRGFLWLFPWNTENGITYVSGFGANSEKSFSGFLPGLTIEQAKSAVLADAERHW